MLISTPIFPHLIFHTNCPIFFLESTNTNHYFVEKYHDLWVNVLQFEMHSSQNLFDKPYHLPRHKPVTKWWKKGKISSEHYFVKKAHNFDRPFLWSTMFALTLSLFLCRWSLYEFHKRVPKKKKKKNRWMLVIPKNSNSQQWNPRNLWLRYVRNSAPLYRGLMPDMSISILLIALYVSKWRRVGYDLFIYWRIASSIIVRKWPRLQM